GIRDSSVTRVQTCALPIYPHVRFDERGWETERCRMAQATAPILDSTKREVLMRAYNVGSLRQKQTSCKAHCHMATPQTSGRGSASPPFSFFHATAMAPLAPKGDGS